MPTRRVREDKKLPTRSYSSKQEKQIAKTFEGTCTSNSGATPWQKGDVLLDKWLLEAKTKTASSNSISIQKEWLLKNDKESLFMGKPYSALVFNFGPGEKNYYVIDEYLFEELVNHLNEKDNV